MGRVTLHATHSDRERHVHEDNGDTRIAAGARAVIARTAAESEGN